MIQGQQTPPVQMNTLVQTEPLWYERMQDMSGYVLADTTLPLLDEQLDFSYSTAPTEYDLNVQNSAISTTEEFILGDQTDAVLSEDSNMFDKSNCGGMFIPNKELLPDSLNENIDDFVISETAKFSVNMINEGSDFLLGKNRPCHNNNTSTKKKPSRYLSIFDSEEPHITGESDVMYCSSDKSTCNVKDEMDVGEFFDSAQPRANEEAKLCYATNGRPLTFAFKDNLEVAEIHKQPNTKEDTETFYYSPESEANVEFADDMEIAEEVVVITEEQDGSKANSVLDSFIFEPASYEEDIMKPEETVKEECLSPGSIVFESDPFSDISVAMGSWFNDIDQLADENFFSNSNHPSEKSEPRSVPQLTLDIDIAASNQLLSKGFSDTPDLLDTLQPQQGTFNLVHFITNNVPADNNNNNVISPETEPCIKKMKEPRKGKSHLSLADLKHAQTYNRGKPSFKITEDQQQHTSSRVSSKLIPSPSSSSRISPGLTLSSSTLKTSQEPIPSPSTSSSRTSVELSESSKSGPCKRGRPARQSATRFKKWIEEGRLESAIDSQSVTSDDEDDAPKSKRKRMISVSSTRKRLNSDSDRSSICEDATKYRERRDRNNLSSKRSRYKRKMQHQLKQFEMKDLEEENLRLKREAERLEELLNKVKAAWNAYLEQLKKNADKD